MAFEVKNPEDGKPKQTTAKTGEKVKRESKPKADAKPKNTKSSRRPSKPGPKNLEAKLTEFVSFAGVAVFPLNQYDGIVLTVRGPALAHAWAELAKVNPTVQRVLERMVEGGVMGGVILATLSVAIPIAQNHGVAANLPLPFGLTGDDVEAAKEASPEIAAMIELQEQVREEAARQAAETPTPTTPSRAAT